MSEHFGDGWSSFTRRVFIRAKPETVFQHWAQSGLLTSWIYETADYLDADGNVRGDNENAQPGDATRWKWNGWEHIHESQVTAIEENSFIEFTFAPAGKVRVEFVSAGPNRTEMVLTQTEVPHETDAEKKDFFYGCSLGWSFWMVNLKAYLEHGIVLNEMDHPYSGDIKQLCQLVNH